MPKCSFCGQEYGPPHGLIFVLPNGNVLNFCSSKCWKNHKLGRRGDKRNWVRKVKKVKGEKKVEEKKVEKLVEKK